MCRKHFSLGCWPCHLHGQGVFPLLRLLCQTYGITGSDNLQGSEEGKRTNKEKRVQRERSEEVHLEKVEQGSIREEKVEIGLLGWLGGGYVLAPHTQATGSEPCRTGCLAPWSPESSCRGCCMKACIRWDPFPGILTLWESGGCDHALLLLLIFDSEVKRGHWSHLSTCEMIL